MGIEVSLGILAVYYGVFMAHSGFEWKPARKPELKPELPRRVQLLQGIANLAYSMGLLGIRHRDLLHAICGATLCTSAFLIFFPKATAKGSFEKSTTIKDCRSDGCLERLSSKTAEVITVFKDCHQRLPKWSLSLKIVIKDCRSDQCL